MRYQPEGPVDIAPFLTVTFDQPMVPLETLAQLDQSDVPVSITPAIDGRWRWIGTRTLRFEVIPGETDRLPAATEYRVEVPAGTTAANGATLADAVAWTFSTPAPRVTAFIGESESLPLEPVFVAVFDQRVDPAAVLDTITLEAAGQRVALRLASAAEIDADDSARATYGNALPDRAVAFRASEPLPVDADLTITIGPGTPSREGPLTSAEPVTYRARTFGALRVVNSSCSYSPECVPGVPFTIEFSNALDMEAFDAGLVDGRPGDPRHAHRRLRQRDPDRRRDGRAHDVPGDARRIAARRVRPDVGRGHRGDVRRRPGQARVVRAATRLDHDRPDGGNSDRVDPDRQPRRRARRGVGGHRRRPAGVPQPTSSGRGPTPIRASRSGRR